MSQPTEDDNDDAAKDDEGDLEDVGAVRGTLEDNNDAATTLLNIASQPNSVRMPAKIEQTREPNSFKAAPSAQSPSSTPPVAPITPVRAAHDSRVEDTPDLSNPLPPSSAGPETPHNH